MVELVVAVTFVAVGAWWFLTRPEKGQSESGDIDTSTGVGVKPKGGETVTTPFGSFVMPSDETIAKLTKVKIEELGREAGVELDRRKTKANMIADLKEAVK